MTKKALKALRKHRWKVINVRECDLKPQKKAQSKKNNIDN